MNEKIINELSEMLSKSKNSSNNNHKNNYNNNYSNNNYNNNSDNPFPNFDMSNIDLETMMKIQKLMTAFNSNRSTPSSNLLNSLKPFLNPSRKEKLDQYVQFMKIAALFETFNKTGGE